MALLRDLVIHYSVSLCTRCIVIGGRTLIEIRFAFPGGYIDRGRYDPDFYMIEIRFAFPGGYIDRGRYDPYFYIPMACQGFRKIYERINVTLCQPRQHHYLKLRLFLPYVSNYQ
ncbi:hypothetical protein SUGI_0653440 [Cryptomeria japonica]|nr:hypothetical protein SUGI_0653440 [Cryptomeria japonica]